MTPDQFGVIAVILKQILAEQRAQTQFLYAILSQANTGHHDSKLAEFVASDAQDLRDSTDQFLDSKMG